MRDELVRIEYGMDRLLWQDPDQDQLDMWAVSLQTSLGSDERGDEARWESVAWAMLTRWMPIAG